jgi:hypothetical protein
MDDLFADFWNTVKEYVPAKERQTAADHIVSVLVDSGVSDSVLYILGDCDKNMKAAVQDQLEDSDIDDWDESEDDDWKY